MMGSENFPFFLYLYYMEDKIKSLIEKFYDDPDNISKNFGGPENFIRFILSKGSKYANLLDPKNQFFYDEGLQDLLIWEQYQASDNKPEFLREFVMEFLSNDLSVEGDKIFWVGDKDDLLFAFDDRGRDATARDIAKTVFNDDFNSWYDNVVNDFYDDCVTSLDSNNKILLSKRIVSELPPLTKDDIEQTTFLEELWEVEGQPETLSITDENIDSLLDDEETTEYIFKQFFSDLKADMENSYWNAYNSAYESELSKNVYDGLEDRFGDSGKMEVVGKNYKGQDNWKFVLDITSSFPYFFKEYFSDWKNHWNQVEYYGSFEQFMKDLFDSGVDQIDFRVPDYPDMDDVVSNYNEYVEI